MHLFYLLFFVSVSFVGLKSRKVLVPVRVFHHSLEDTLKDPGSHVTYDVFGHSLSNHFLYQGTVVRRAVRVCAFVCLVASLRLLPIRCFTVVGFVLDFHLKQTHYQPSPRSKNAIIPCRQLRPVSTRLKWCS